ncbi:DUF6702 family protein [Chondrinema litorale]|uniref:DUF6702 family protein n=1 Tax=Chondrinema litorale TaxID=2994555 RepID=UPI002542D399|nr:DUF6702 family protein [Chondrinema litorale]UZR94697.1 hypothetical protein OQ292_02555 [Chondrinema litorale]
MNGLQFFLGLILIVITPQVNFQTQKNKTEAGKHAIYISVCELEYQAESIQIKIKTFTNDLEDAIHNQTGEAVSIDGNPESTKVNNLISEYLLSHINFVADTKKLELQFKKRVKESDATWAYYEVKNAEDFKELEVKNNLFLELFETQLNVVSVSYNSEKKFLRLDKNKTKDILKF